MTAAVTAGPALGVGRRWRGALDFRRRAWGVGVLPGVLIGEGLTSLASVAETTYPPYWFGSIIFGVLLLGILGWEELASFRAWALAIAVAVAVSLAFVVAYLVVLPGLF